MMDNRQQIEALVIMLFEGYPSLLNATEAMVAAYVRPCLTLSPEAVRRAVDRFTLGEVPGHPAKYPPNATQFYLEAQMHQGAMERAGAPRVSVDAPDGYKTLPDGTVIVPIGKPFPKGYVPLGPTKADFGHGMIDMSWMTPEQKRRVLLSKGEDVPQRGESRALVA